MLGFLIGNIIIVPIILVILISMSGCNGVEKQDKRSEFGIVVHGGAGGVTREAISPEMDAAYREALIEALKVGYDILRKGGSSMDAVEAAIRILEDDSLFNAGRGSVFTAEGTNELDASFMDGKTLNAGAVAGVKRIKNPITLARIVMENSPHVLMAREGAEEFGARYGIETVPEEYFFTKRRWEALERAREREAEQQTLSTVGAVALDRDGNLAAGTSTGGMTNKLFGRVGDSPIIGAGTYANNNTCAVSATGHGEYFIRGVVSYDISALIEYKDNSLEEAAGYVVMDKLSEIGGRGGVISIDKFGNIAMPFNTEGMHRGFVLDDGKFVVKLYGDE